MCASRLLAAHRIILLPSPVLYSTPTFAFVTRCGNEEEDAAGATRDADGPGRGESAEICGMGTHMESDMAAHKLD